jgi:hypothetical protein
MLSCAHLCLIFYIHVYVIALCLDAKHRQHAVSGCFPALALCMCLVYFQHTCTQHCQQIASSMNAETSSRQNNISRTPGNNLRAYVHIHNIRKGYEPLEHSPKLLVKILQISRGNSSLKCCCKRHAYLSMMLLRRCMRTCH